MGARRAMWGMLLLTACGTSGATDDDGKHEMLEIPTTYAYLSRFEAEKSSVAYSGQVFRQVLMLELKDHIEGLTERIDTGALSPAAGEVARELAFFYDFDAQTSLEVEIDLDTSMPTKQTRYGDISSGALLRDKVAGNDAVGQHEDWSTAFVGWDAPGVTTPDSLVELWFEELDALAVRRANGDIPVSPTGEPIAVVHVTQQGHDLAQLLQKFLGVAIAVSQGADDYLDDDLDGKGIRSDNTKAEEGKPYATLEHAWDEAFGYFGAARNFADYTDDEIAAKGGRPEYQGGYHDSDGDGAIDLMSEYNFGHAVNAAKRDRDSAASAPTDFTKEAFDAFLHGRAIIAAADGALSNEAMGDLMAQRDLAVAAWEKAIAATVVHYLNQVIQMMAAFGTPDYDFLEHAEEWSELKGFALGFQFNPRSPLPDDDFARLHQLIGTEPALPGAPNASSYRSALIEARSLLAAAYEFDPANVGDDDGLGGW